MIEPTRGRPRQRDGLSRAARICGGRLPRRRATAVLPAPKMRLRVRCGVSSPHRAPDRPAPLRPARRRPEPRPRAKTRVAIPGVARRQELPAAPEQGPTRRRGACATPPRGALLGRGGQPLAAGNSWDRNPCLRTRSCRPCNSACDCYMGDELHADMMQSTCARPTRGATLLGGSFQGPCSLPLLHVLPADVERGSSPCSLSKPELPGPAVADARDHLWSQKVVMLATPRALLVPLHPSLRV
jgi:hypothetical protein